MNLDKIFDFIKFSHKFQQVRRVLLVNGEDRKENDAEHSFQLVLLAWYLINGKGLDLDMKKVFMYATAHDLVEVYAGDTYFYTEDLELRNSKKSREKEAARRIINEFPEFSELHDIIEKYENLDDEEARFVYALDKILPVINIYLDGGRSWKIEGVTYEMLRTKDEKVKKSKIIDEIWVELVKILEKEKLDLFKR